MPPAWHDGGSWLMGHDSLQISWLMGHDSLQICRLRGAMAVRGWDMTRFARGMTAEKENRGT